MDAPPKEEETVETTSYSGEVLFCGGKMWDVPVSRWNKKTDLVSMPHRIRCVMDKNVVHLCTSPIAVHCGVILDDGSLWMWGKNDEGQLGVGDKHHRWAPTQVVGIPDGAKVIDVALGRSHTLVVTEDGQLWATGTNKHGELGLGKAHKAKTNFVPVESISNAMKVACGTEFSILLLKNGVLLACGSPEYGQLGDGQEGKYFEGSTKLKISYAFRFQPVENISAIIQDIACGSHHAIVLDALGHVWTWGFGAYGRLGHGDNKDQLCPKSIDFFERPRLEVASIAAGGTCGFAVTRDGGIMYQWGITKKSGEADMYPKINLNFVRMDIRSISCGPTSCVVAADDDVASWGAGPTFGELAYGEKGPKTSTTPKIVETLSSLFTHEVGMGWGFSLFLVRKDLDALEAFPILETPPFESKQRKKRTKKEAGGKKKRTK